MASLDPLSFQWLMMDIYQTAKNSSTVDLEIRISQFLHTLNFEWMGN